MEQEQRQAAKRQMLELMQAGQPWQAAAAAGLAIFKLDREKNSLRDLLTIVNC